MNNSQEAITDLVALLRDTSSTFSSTEQVLRISDSRENQHVLANLSITYSVTRQHIEIPVSAFNPVLFYWDISSFLKGVAQVQEPFSHSIVIYNSGRCLLWMNRTIQNDSDGTDYAKIFEVSNAYIKLRNFLLNLAEDPERNQEFLEYYNEASKKFLLSSHVDTKRVTIAFPTQIPNLDFSINVTPAVDRLINAFDNESKHLPVFIKNEIIGNLHMVNESERLKKLFENLSRLLDSARLNFSVYLNNLSIDKLKQDYKEYKSKYFDQYSSLVSKISTQVITLPVTAIGSGIAIDKVTDSLVLSIIIVVLLIVSIYVGAIVRHYSGDVVFLKSSFQSDYEKISKSEFFINHPDELNDFKMIKDKFEKKTAFIKDYLNTYYWIALLLNMLLMGLVATKAQVPIEAIIWVGLFLFTLAKVNFRLVLRHE
ncbi:MAG: hypothetical protein ABJN36_06280 [Cyclobacteriaceae bacterium]